ncbi:MAG: sulfatase/phosphatase domain-containing protein, partial [Verrucomicrobiota bacterium]
TLHDYGMRVPMLIKWEGTITPGQTYDGIVANIDVAPTIMDIVGITPPADYEFDGLSFKDVLYGSKKPLREVLFGELGHSRAVLTKSWKYIAIRYPEDVQAKIDAGQKFSGWQGRELDRPYLTRNGHLGFHASQANPNYFELDQLYNRKTDIAETQNIYSQNPEVAATMKRYLATALSEFENRPFGEFTR